MNRFDIACEVLTKPVPALNPSKSCFSNRYCNEQYWFGVQGWYESLSPEEAECCQDEFAKREQEYLQVEDAIQAREAAKTRTSMQGHLDRVYKQHEVAMEGGNMAGCLAWQENDDLKH